MQNLAQAAYGYNPAAAAMSVPTTATQFQQKAAYGSSYGNYDAIGQPGGAGKDFASSYSATNAVAAAAAAAAKKPGSNSGTGTGQSRSHFLLDTILERIPLIDLLPEPVRPSSEIARARFNTKLHAK